MIGIEQVSFSNMVPVRWFSSMNPEMDCIVFVPSERKLSTESLITEAIEKLWDNEDSCYGDEIETALQNEGIPYVILYPEWTADGKACVPEWDNWADSI